MFVVVVTVSVPVTTCYFLVSALQMAAESVEPYGDGGSVGIRDGDSCC